MRQKDCAQDESKINVGIHLYKHITMLDVYGPLQFFNAVDEFCHFTFSEDGEPVESDSGIDLLPTYGFYNCPDIDILVVGGTGDVLSQLTQLKCKKDKRYTQENPLEFLREKGEKAQYVTSVCTGAFILAEAGLLDGYKAATYWAYSELLNRYPNVTPVDERVCIHRNRITGGGVTAGMDFALVVILEVLSKLYENDTCKNYDPKFFALEQVKRTQLSLEYRPERRFNYTPDNSPETAHELRRHMSEKYEWDKIRQHIDGNTIDGNT